jgi:methyl-accepting chemotaxis protein
MFGEMKVSTRLTLAFGVVLVLLVGVISLGIGRMMQVNDGLRTITEENMVEMGHAYAMRASAYQVSVSLRNLMLNTEDEKLKADESALHKAYTDFDAHSNGLEKKFAGIATTSQGAKDLLATVKNEWLELQSLFDKTTSLSLAHKRQDAYNFYMLESGASQKNASMRDTLDQLAALEEKLSDAEVVKAHDTYESARTAMLGLGILAVVVAVLAAVLVTRSLIKQLGGEPGYEDQFVKFG